MSRRKKVFGFCKLCGSEGQLSYEHVPPEAAFNKNQYFYFSTLENLVKLENDAIDINNKNIFNLEKLKKKQGGIGFYSLCEKCNNNTGSWYGSDFVDWAHQSMAILLKANGKPTLIYPTYFFPLRAIKQILTMFCSINVEGFTKHEPKLVKFLLNKEERFLDKRYRIYCYYNLQGMQRYLGNNFVGDFGVSTKPIHMSEIAFPPFGFIMTFDSKKPDTRLFDISEFANFRYNDWIDFNQKFPVLPTYLPHIPADYRTKDEIKEALLSNLLTGNNL